MFVSDHDPNLKGNVAELKIQAALASIGLPVLCPVTEHERYDLVIELKHRFLRIQCKYAPIYRGVICVRTNSSRRGPSGFIRAPYTANEIDGIAAYCPDLDRCYLLPIDAIGTTNQITLRLDPPKNGQRACLNWAADYELPGAIAQLGERLHGMQEVVGSSPTSSTPPEPALGAHEYREKLG